MVNSRVSKWLGEAGLGEYAGNFAPLSEQDFLSLLMSDYAQFGVQSMEHKQKLFRLIKSVNNELKSAQQAPPPKANMARLEVGNELLDLDAHDGDLLAHACGPAFQLSPMGSAKQRAPSAPAPAAPAAPPPPVQAAPPPPAVAQGLPRNPLEEVDPPRIRVIVRKRPINKKEKERGDEDVVEVSMEHAYVIVNEPKVKVDLTKYVDRHQFNFDESLDETVTNEQVYRTTVQPLVHTLFKNGRATCFAYGQTGSGKTYTMSPLPVRAAADILRYLVRPEYRDIGLYVSCFEIYGNKVFDLLNNRKKLNILEDAKKKVVVVGLKEYAVENVDYLKHLIDTGNNQRSTGSTAANADSSRSHSIMQFSLKVPSKGGEMILAGKISFIDLAGSERGADTFDNNRQTRMEGAEINKSLLALKECIRALDSDARHVPFRGSKLTAVLRDSFLGEQARTVMIANISPCSTSVEHSLNTLRYADRVKELRKEKAERAPGGVTPGDEAYYASAARGADAPRDQSPTKDVRMDARMARPKTPSKAEMMVELNAEDEDLLRQREELMDTIIEEEEQLITAHRLQIEENMDMVRKEMNLLTEVDQPGSAIDQYVEKLDNILKQKMAGILELRGKLDKFREHLKAEEQLSKTFGAAHRQWAPV